MALLAEYAAIRLAVVAAGVTTSLLMFDYLGNAPREKEMATLLMGHRPQYG
jgi:hypothetical protein